MKWLTTVLEFRGILFLKEEILRVYCRWEKSNLESILQEHQKITCRTQFSYQKPGRRKETVNFSESLKRGYCHSITFPKSERKYDFVKSWFQEININVKSSQTENVCDQKNRLILRAAKVSNSTRQWEMRIKLRYYQYGKQELLHRCGHHFTSPGTTKPVSRQMVSLAYFHRKKQRGNHRLTWLLLLPCQENWKPWRLDAKIGT